MEFIKKINKVLTAFQKYVNDLFALKNLIGLHWVCPHFGYKPRIEWFG